MSELKFKLTHTSDDKEISNELLNNFIYEQYDFLIRRIENCHIKINQLKNKKSIRDNTKEDII